MHESQIVGTCINKKDDISAYGQYASDTTMCVEEWTFGYTIYACSTLF